MLREPVVRRAPGVTSRRAVSALSLLAPAVFAIVTLAPFHPSTARASDSGSGRYVLHGKRVTICNAIGEATMVPTDGPDVVVEVTKRGPDADRLRFEVGQCDGAERLRIVYPGNRVVDPEMDGNSLRETTLEGCCQTERIRFTRKGDGLNARADLVIHVPRDVRLSLGLAAGSVKAERLNASLDIDTGSATILITDMTGALAIDSGSGGATITGFRGALAIDSGSGGIEIEELDGKLSVDSGSGGVTLSRVRADKMAIDAGSGPIKGDDLVAGSMAVDSGSGGIDLVRLNGETISLECGSGGIHADLVDSPRSLHIESGSGGVQLTAPRDLDATLQISCSKKQLDVGVPVTASKISSSYFEGVAGSGRGLIVIENGSGGVSLQTRSN